VLLCCLDFLWMNLLALFGEGVIEDNKLFAVKEA
jgi:hypothetical protein